LRRLGLYVDGATLADSRAQAGTIAALGPGYLQARLDLRDPDIYLQLDEVLALATTVGCAVALDVIIAGRAPEDELASLGKWIEARHPLLDMLFVIPARDFSNRAPNSTPAREATGEHILAAARRLVPGVPIVGGRPTGFPELNRNRPLPGGFEFVTHATQAIVHAADDISVMETLAALPYVMRSTHSFAAGVAYRLGPATIGILPGAAA
jgi:hypothetical protein